MSILQLLFLSQFQQANLLKTDLTSSTGTIGTLVPTNASGGKASIYTVPYTPASNLDANATLTASWEDIKMQ